MTRKPYKELRQGLGTQAEVAALLGVARETIARRETGKDKLTKEAWYAMVGLNHSMKGIK